MKLNLNCRKSHQKYANTWKVNNLFLNDYTTTEEIKTEIKRFIKTNDNMDISYHHLWDTIEAVIRRKFIAISAQKKKLVRMVMNDNLKTHLREL